MIERIDRLTCGILVGLDCISNRDVHFLTYLEKISHSNDVIVKNKRFKFETHARFSTILCLFFSSQWNKPHIQYNDGKLTLVLIPLASLAYADAVFLLARSCIVRPRLFLFLFLLIFFSHTALEQRISSNLVSHSSNQEHTRATSTLST